MTTETKPHAGQFSLVKSVYFIVLAYSSLIKSAFKCHPLPLANRSSIL